MVMGWKGEGAPEPALTALNPAMPQGSLPSARCEGPIGIGAPMERCLRGSASYFKGKIMVIQLR